jgi:mannosyl-3-phosphoglycerate phosphatase family protein
MTRIIVFTDLDGTLLDEHTYSASSSIQALKHLRSSNVPIIFCSSKTRQEQEVIRASLGIEDPFIVENGSAIIVPPRTINITGKFNTEDDGTRVMVLGKPVHQIRTLLNEIRIEMDLTFETFNDLPPERIAQITGLDLEAAQRARMREYTEPIVTTFEPEELTLFLQACEQRNLQAVFGGRFLSVSGKGADKGAAVKLLTACFRLKFENVITIGAGDSPNDAAMLQAVDYAYLVQRPDGTWRDLDGVDLIYVPAIGPLGFTAMVDDIERRWEGRSSPDPTL